MSNNIPHNAIKIKNGVTTKRIYIDYKNVKFTSDNIQISETASISSLGNTLFFFTLLNIVRSNMVALTEHDLSAEGKPVILHLDTNEIPLAKPITFNEGASEVDYIYCIPIEEDIDEAPLVEQLPIDSALVQAVGNIDKLNDVSKYQKNKLAMNLKNKGVEVLENDVMSDLIDKVEDIEVEGHNLPKWFPTNKTFLTASKRTNSTSSYKMCGFDKKIYVIGGKNSTGSATNINESFDTFTNKWGSNGKSMTFSRYDHSMGVSNDKIYVIGGRTSNTGYVNYNECYDIKSNTWTTKKNMSTPKILMGFQSFGDNIYILGGLVNNSATNSNECYNTASNTWSTKTNMINVSFNMAIGLHQENIYAIEYDINQCYNITSNTWSTKSSPQKIREKCVSAPVGTKIYMIGGSRDYQSVREIECYDMESDSYTVEGYCDYNTGGSSSGVVDGIIYFITIEGDTKCYIP